MSSTTSAVSGPVAMVTLAAVVSVVLIVSSLFTKSRTVFGAVRLLVLFTSTDKVFTSAVRPSIPTRPALATSAFNAM